jgi:hypothetical protein
MWQCTYHCTENMLHLDYTQQLFMLFMQILALHSIGLTKGIRTGCGLCVGTFNIIEGRTHNNSCVVSAKMVTKGIHIVPHVIFRAI